MQIAVTGDRAVVGPRAVGRLLRHLSVLTLASSLPGGNPGPGDRRRPSGYRRPSGLRGAPS